MGEGHQAIGRESRLTELIGFIGLGAMGAPMARHLAGLGYRLLVHDVNPRAVQSVVDCGAQAIASPKAIASEAKLVFTCLPSLEALRQVVLGDDGLRAGDAIRTYVDLSTTGANFAREMATALRQSGIMMLDSPITGNVITAGNGKLGIMCSGPLAAFRHAKPVMRDLASVIVLYLGDETGRAQRLKLLNNLLSATGMAASCEAFILGVKAGLDPETMLEIINFGRGEQQCHAQQVPTVDPAAAFRLRRANGDHCQRYIAHRERGGGARRPDVDRAVGAAGLEVCGIARWGGERRYRAHHVPRTVGRGRSARAWRGSAAAAGRCDCEQEGRRTRHRVRRKDRSLLLRAGCVSRTGALQ